MILPTRVTHILLNAAARLLCKLRVREPHLLTVAASARNVVLAAIQFQRCTPCIKFACIKNFFFSFVCFLLP